MYGTAAPCRTSAHEKSARRSRAVQGSRQERAEASSPHPPIQPLLRVQLLVVLRDRRVAHRFLLAEAEDAEHLEAVEKELHHVLLQRVVEVDEDVPAEDDVEMIERRVGDEVVLREDDVLA